MTLLLLLTILWDPVTLREDCTILPTVYYEVRYASRRIVGQQPCDPSDPNSGMCPVYSEFVWRGPVQTFDGHLDTDELPLAPGELFIAEVTTIDMQGRRDRGIECHK